MKSHWMLILGMTLVTFLPRLLPMVALSKRPLHPLAQRFLLYIPYTALGALIVRGALQGMPEMPPAAWAGIVVAGVCAWFNGGMVVSVLLSIAAVFLIVSVFS